MNSCFSTEITACTFPESVLKLRCCDHLDLSLTHSLEGGVRIQGFQLIKCGLNFLQSGFRLLLIPFIGSAM
jgi:hypothetical protein